MVRRSNSSPDNTTEHGVLGADYDARMSSGNFVLLLRVGSATSTDSFARSVCSFVSSTPRGLLLHLARISPSRLTESYS